MTTVPQCEFERGEHKFQNIISQAPVLISTFIGSAFIVETINKMGCEIWDKSYEDVINKPLFESSPELAEGLKKILDNIYIQQESLLFPTKYPYN